MTKEPATSGHSPTSSLGSWKKPFLVLAVIAVLGVAGVTWFKFLTCRIAPSSPAAVLANPTAKTDPLPAGNTDKEDDPLDSVVEKLLPSSEQTSREVKYLDIVKLQMNYWMLEDEVFAKAPKYSEVRDDMKAKAREVLGSADTQTAMTKASEELDAFWQCGALASPESYDRGYLACAILEVKLEDDPDNFQLLCKLKEALSSVTVLRNAAATKIFPDAFNALWPIVEKQKELIESGKVPPSADSMLAMCDWAHIVTVVKRDNKAAAPAWRWLVDNADTGGWPKMKSTFERALANAENNKGYVIAMFSYPASNLSFEQDMLMTAKCGRRVMSFAGGPKEYREKLICQWKDWRGSSKPGNLLFQAPPKSGS